MDYHPFLDLKKLISQEKDYTKDNKKTIGDNNERMLQISCILYLLVLMFYFFAGIFIEAPSQLVYLHIGFGLFQVLFTIYVALYSKSKHRSFLKTQRICAAFELSVLLFFGFEGVIGYPETHSLYIPIAIMLVVLIFCHSAKYMISIMTLYCLGFALASYFIKTPEVAFFDIQIAFATFLASLAGFILLLKMRQSERSAIYASTIDDLTDVYNKSAMANLCNSYIEKIKKEHFGSCAFVIIDLDNFKHVNDEYGHKEGDRVLKEFGLMLKASFFDRDFAGRFGGDEFVVMMCSDTRSQLFVEQKMKIIVENTKNIIFGNNEHLSCSIGVAIHTEEQNSSENFNDIFNRADKALYQMKKEGKGNYKISLG